MTTVPMRFIVTAGPTREYIDPVRFISNPSTGRMGFAVARAACALGHTVTLIAGPVVQKTPQGVVRQDVVSARDILAALQAELHKDFAGMTILVMTAAVADWRPVVCAPTKLKKAEMADTLKLVRNPDILKTLNRTLPAARKRKLVRIGFAAETGNPEAEAARKCREKGLACVVANDVTAAGAGFGTRTNRVTLVYPDGRIEPWPLLSKYTVARRLVLWAQHVAEAQWNA